MAKQPKTFDHTAELAFVDAANPHQWLLTAISLHEQAIALWRNRGKSQLTQTAKDGTRTTWDDTNRATFLLAAFAMENIIKAFLVYEHPAFIAGGRIQGITTHDLVKLSEQSTLVPYAMRDRWVFEALAEGSTSWARYPCGRDADDVRPEGQFTARLWVKYCDMMAAYTAKLRKLLTKGWKGPYGRYGNWTFQMQR